MLRGASLMEVEIAVVWNGIWYVAETKKTGGISSSATGFGTAIKQPHHLFQLSDTKAH